MDFIATTRMLGKILPSYINRHKMNLADPKSAVEEKRVHLHYWRYSADGRHNLGDYLSEVVVEHMKECAGVESSREPCSRHLYAIGSILQAGYQNATVWGSGFLADPLAGGLSRCFHSSRMRRLDVRAVRGPLTRQALLALGHDCPEVYGDPAILMPEIYMPDSTEKTRAYGVVCHYLDTSVSDNAINILTRDYRTFIDELVRSERIISSSLHGIILAEAYGIPAVLYRPEGLELPLFKYEDYYLGTGRREFPVAATVEEALQVTPCALPELAKQRDALTEAFPADLWE